MSETREVFDPFKGETVKVNNDLVSRLRGQYAVGPTLPNGEPEFGYRQMGEPSAIQLEAAAEIEALSRIVYYYVAGGWPRYTGKEVPHKWPDGANEVQSRALTRVQKLHAEALKSKTDN